MLSFCVTAVTSSCVLVVAGDDVSVLLQGLSEEAELHVSRSSEAWCWWRSEMSDLWHDRAGKSRCLLSTQEAV